MSIELDLYNSAVALIEKRYSSEEGGAAALRTESGKILTGVAPDTQNDALSLCMEVGPCLEAHKLNESITHSLCLYREQGSEQFLVLTPCGICQERLVHWGGDVQVAISNPENNLIFKPLRDLLQYHWSQVNGHNL
jgi:cytidine deaminase